MLAVIVIAVVVVIVALGLGVGAKTLLRTEFGALRRQSNDELTAWRADAAQQLAERTPRSTGASASYETMDRRLGDLDTKVDRRLETRPEDDDGDPRAPRQGRQRAAQMLERAKDLSRLEQALRPPKARGGFGELLLENLLRDRLPPSAYAMQHTFSSGDRVDAVVRAGQLIPVDSKFPFDNYQRIVEAQNDDEASSTRRRSRAT